MASKKYLMQYFTAGVCVCVYVCVYVCVCMYVCVCVFILFYRGGFFRLQDVWDILEGYGSTMLCCKYYSRCFCEVSSSPFLNMSYFTSEDETPACRNWRKNDMMQDSAERWYMLIQDIIRPITKPKTDKKIL